jgi:hypothetical protein
MRSFKFLNGYAGPTLVATWTPAVENNLFSSNGIDAERELTSLLSEQIARQIDNDILTQLFRDSNEGMRA